MKHKIYLGVIVLLIFAVVISLTSEDAETSALKTKLTGMKDLEEENADLKQKINDMEEKSQDLKTKLAIKSAAAFKRKQYTVANNVDYENHSIQELETVYNKFGEHATKKHIKKMAMAAIIPYIIQLSHETKSNLSVKELSFEVGEMETETEVSLDYNIEIAFDPVSSDGEKRTTTNFGQLRVIKTEDGWKVNEDMERMKSTGEVMKEFTIH